MADEHNVVRGISWNEVFGFSHIFKSFKMAWQPGKIILALLAIGLTCALGLVMDPIWSCASDSAVVKQNEVWEYWMAPNRRTFLDYKQNWLEETRVETLSGMLRGLPDIEDADKSASEDFKGGLKKVKKDLKETYEKSLSKADTQWAKERETNKELPGPKERQKKDKDSDIARLKTKRRVLEVYMTGKNNLRKIEGDGIFAGFLEWQNWCFSNAIKAIRRGNIVTGLTDLRNQHGSITPNPLRDPAVPNSTPADTVPTNREGYGVLAWLALMGWGLWWMISTHWFYSLVFFAIALAIWTVFGGAICRMAALHAAREEKISMVSAVKFSMSKFFSFLSAPLLPIVGIVFCGMFLALGGAAGAIPYAGELFVGIFFFLALILGIVITFLTFGLVSGAPLMWPTIAVEGSDAFDAFSHSFSYPFQRPFRYGLYWLVAAGYGTICYLFVRLFAFIALLMIHFWTGWAMKIAGRDEYAPGAGKLDTMWAQPTFDSFHGPFQFEVMGRWEGFSAVILSGWVYLVIGIVAAFGVCFVFSAATNIYYILRRKIDATDLDDVYVEEAGDFEEGLEENTPDLIEPTTTESAEETPAEEKPAEEKPAEEKPVRKKRARKKPAEEKPAQGEEKPTEGEEDPDKKESE